MTVRRCILAIIVLLLLCVSSFNPIVDSLVGDNLESEEPSSSFTSETGATSNNAISFYSNIEISLDYSNPWIWLETQSQTRSTWINVTGSFESLYQGGIIRAYTSSGECINEYIYTWGSSSICINEANDPTIILVVDMSWNGNDPPEEDFSGTYNVTAESIIEQTPEPNPEPYEFPDGALNSDSYWGLPTIFPMGQTQLSGWFETEYDNDVVELEWNLLKTHKARMVFNGNVSISSTGGLECEGANYQQNLSLMSIDCEVISASNYIYFSGASHNYSSGPVNWQIDVTYTQVYPIEDPDYGDAPPSDTGKLRKWWIEGDEISARLSDWGDVDIFSFAIAHGVIQSFAINSEVTDSTVSFYNSQGQPLYCQFIATPATWNLGNYTAHSFSLTGGEISTIKCDTTQISDYYYLVFQSTYGDIGNYSMSIFAELSSLRPELGDNGDIDAPPRDSNYKLNMGDVWDTAGTFLHASDTLDSYFVEIPEGYQVDVTLHSKCAVIEERTSQLGDISNVYFSNPLEEGAIQFTLTVQRQEIPVGIPAHVIEPCIYTIHTVQEMIPEGFDFPYPSQALSLTNPLTIDNCTQDWIAAGYDTRYPIDWEATIPLHLLSANSGSITATQESGNPITISLGRQYYSTSIDSVGSIDVGQMIEVGSEHIWWNNVRLSGLDCSQVSIILSQKQIPLFTNEINELLSIGAGALGFSRDEGYDDYDQWVTSPENASFISVKLTHLSENIDAKIDGWKLSRNFCVYDDYPKSFNVSLIEGNGQYTLQTERYYDGCISSTIDAPQYVDSGMTFVAKADIFQSGEDNGEDWLLSFELLDKNLTVLSSSEEFSTGEYVQLSIPDDYEQDDVYLQLLHNNLVIDEEVIQFASNQLSVTQSTTILDIYSSPAVTVLAREYASGDPLDWTLSNMTFSSLSEIGEIVELSQPSEYSGLGTEVVELSRPENLRPGSLLSLDGEVEIEGVRSPFIAYWYVGLIDIELSCDTYVQPIESALINDIACTISARLGTVPFSTSSIAPNSEISGTIQIISDSGELMRNSSFSTDTNGDYFSRISIDKIDTGDTGTIAEAGNYSIRVVLSPEFIDMYGSRDYSRLEIARTILSSGESGYGNFDLTIYSARDSALSGDEILVNWATTGELPAHLYWELSTNAEDFVSGIITPVANETNGEFSITIPTHQDETRYYRIEIRAYSIFGSLSYDYLQIGGIDDTQVMLIDIEPERPTAGNNFSATIFLTDSGNWLYWEWSLFSGGAVISQGEGWIESNQATMDVNLPLGDYPGGLVLLVTAEIASGERVTDSVAIEPMPMREMQVELPMEVVAGERFEIDWKITGSELNSIDSVTNIRLSMARVGISNSEFSQVFVVDGPSGIIGVTLPADITTGTYVISLQFDMRDGETEEFVEIITVSSQSPGINFLGLNIPPMAGGWDSILLILLLLHAFTLTGISVYRRRQTREAEKLDIDWQQDEEGFEVVEENVGYLLPTTDVVMPIISEERQEHPIGSGKWWVRSTPEEEWREEV